MELQEADNQVPTVNRTFLSGEEHVFRLSYPAIFRSIYLNILDRNKN
jgi:hypothetical protein